MPAVYQPTDAFLLSDARLPIFNEGGAAGKEKPEFLAAAALSGAMERCRNQDGASLSASELEHVFCGSVYGAQQIQSFVRLVQDEAGVPDTVPGSDTNHVCASSADCAVQAQSQINNDTIDLAAVVGVENATYAGRSVSFDVGLTCFRQDSKMIELVQSLAKRCENGLFIPGGMIPGFPDDRTLPPISREDIDDFSISSYLRALDAQANGRLGMEIVGYTPGGVGTPILTDEEITVDGGMYINPDGSLDEEKIRAETSPLGPCTRANSSLVSDGAAAAVIASARKTLELGIKPKVCIRGSATFGIDPAKFPLGPIGAIMKLLRKQKLTVQDIGLWNGNEAFGFQALVSMLILGIDPEKINVNGGAVAIGHPLGASGIRCLNSLVYEMEWKGVKYGIVFLCVGGGQGIAVLLETVETPFQLAA